MLLAFSLTYEQRMIRVQHVMFAFCSPGHTPAQHVPVDCPTLPPLKHPMPVPRVDAKRSRSHSELP